MVTAASIASLLSFGEPPIGSVSAVRGEWDAHHEKDTS